MCVEQFLFSMTLQTGKSGLVKAECAVFFWHSCYIRVSADKSSRLWKLHGVPAEQNRKWYHTCVIWQPLIYNSALCHGKDLLQKEEGQRHSSATIHLLKYPSCMSFSTLAASQPFVPCWVGGVTCWALSVHLFDVVSLNSTLWRASSHMSIRPPFQSICHIPGAKLAIIQSAATTTPNLK